MSFVAGQYRMLAFYLRDVRPAIRARRAVRREDVIFHLLDQGYSNREILTECLTYGAAGMATTSEFIVMAAWHLFERENLQRRLIPGPGLAQAVATQELAREKIIAASEARPTSET